MDPRLLVIPIFFLFEVWQLYISERYLGVKSIGRDVDPRALGLSEKTAFAWCVGIFVSWAWMIFLLFERRTRMQAVCMIAVTAVGYLLRRNSGLKWVLVILTLEGALRIGMILSLVVMTFFRYRGVYSLYPR